MEESLFLVDIERANGESRRSLKRAAGHLKKVIDMMDQRSPPVDVAQQLQAVTNALASAKRVYVQNHIQHLLQCVKDGDTAKSREDAIKDFKEIAKYL